MGRTARKRASSDCQGSAFSVSRYVPPLPVSALRDYSFSGTVVSTQGYATSFRRVSRGAVDYTNQLIIYFHLEVVHAPLAFLIRCCFFEILDPPAIDPLPIVVSSVCVVRIIIILKAAFFFLCSSRTSCSTPCSPLTPVFQIS